VIIEKGKFTKRAIGLNQRFEIERILNSVDKLAHLASFLCSSVVERV